jgi:hypothetical protein
MRLDGCEAAASHVGSIVADAGQRLDIGDGPLNACYRAQIQN